MKVLIAEDERVARKILETFLLKEGYEVVTAEDGSSALKCALTFTEPYIAILDWVMPGLTGPQVCVCLRSPKLKIRPYIIVLSARSDKSDIAAVLDAGADDFLTKPFNQVELMARLRVAARTLQYHADLRQQIGHLEALVQRYNLLGEIVAQHASGRLTTPPIKPAPDLAGINLQPAKASGIPVDPHNFFIKPASVPDKGPTVPAKVAGPAAPGKADKPPGKNEVASTEAVETPAKAEVPVEVKPELPPVDLSAAEIDIIMQQVVAELGFGTVGDITNVNSDKYHAAEFTAWAGMILEREQVWIDLLLEVDDAALAMIFEQTLGRRPESIQERENFLAETHTIFSSAYKSALINKGATVMSPILSRALRTKDRSVPVPAKCEKHRYVLAGGSIGLTVVRHECLLKKKSTQRLRNSDIMAEAYPPTSVNEMPLLNKGTMLTYRFIEKLVALEEGQEERLIVPVFSTSSLAMYFTNQES